MTARPYRSNDHLATVITSDAGSIWLCPQEADRIYFDIAKASHLPANLPDSRNGSRVLDIGRGVQIRASGSVYLDGDTWTIRDSIYPEQYPSGRALTAQQTQRAREVIAGMIGEWAKTHEGDIAQADDIYRNNGAGTLEEKIETHKAALKILCRELRACENGRDFTQYPKLPTEGR